MKISVVIPLYNKANYIVSCITSVLAQTYEDFEIIVVDDGSTDEGVDTLNFVCGSDPRLKVISQPNSGVSAARNRGMNEAQGEIIAFLDADDEWMLNHLENIAEAATAYPQAALIGAGYRRLGSKGYVAEVTIDCRGACLIKDYFRMAAHANFLTMSSSAVRRSIYEKLGGFAVGEPLGEDRAFYAKYALCYPVAYHSAISAIYHNEVTDGAMSTYKNNWPDKEPLLARQLREWRQDKNRSAALPASLDNYVANVLYEYIVIGVMAGQSSRAKVLLKDKFFFGRNLRRKAKALYFAICWLPEPVLRLCLRLSRSRWMQKKVTVRDGVIQRCIKRKSAR
ncbi:MAG: glycosyltransferase family 2 protein [Armatimonadetes bacterium]|nr:glycosyltransferase family 2 protein [Armatimonadota bacterium]